MIDLDEESLLTLAPYHCILCHVQHFHCPNELDGLELYLHNNLDVFHGNLLVYDLFVSCVCSLAH